MDLNQFARSAPDLDNWSHSEKIKFFGWFLHTFKDRERFRQADVRACYDDLHLEKPSDVSPYLNQLTNRKPKQLLIDSKGYYLPKAVRDSFNSRYGQRTTTVEVDKLLLDLPLRIADLNERAFLEEALICFRADAFRAAIVMSWNMAFDHLCEWIIKNHLPAFNAQLPRSYPKARINTINIKDDFEQMQESETLQVCRSANITTPSVHKILSDKLGKRNSAAHPSNIVINRLTTEEFISDLINNAILKLT